MEDQLNAVTAQLEALQSQVRALAKKAAAADERADMPPPPDKPPSLHAGSKSQYLSRTTAQEVLSLETASSEDDTVLIRPTVYPHKPEARLDGLEREGFEDREFLDALKLETFEGFYNLAMLILVFAMSYLIARNFREKGILFDLNDFTCAPLHRDVMSIAQVIVLCYAWSLMNFLLVKLWASRKISWNLSLYCYIAVQVVMVFGPVTFLYVTPTAPLPSAVLLMASIILALKMHSYMATNYALSVEHTKRYGASQKLNDAASESVDASPTPQVTPQIAVPRTKSGLKRRKGKAKLSSGSEKSTSTPRDAASSDEDHGDDEYDLDREGDAKLSRVRRHHFSRHLDRAPADVTAAPTQPPLRAVFEPERDTGRAQLKVGFAPYQEASAPVGGSNPTPSPHSDSGYISGSPSQKRRMIKSWPHNIGLKDYGFFLAAPTLVYEPRYPRTRRIRWSYVAKKLFQASLCAVIQYAVMKQLILPVLQRPSPAQDDSPTAEAFAIIFDLMKLGIPSLVVWLTGFYAMFHCWLNILAELLRFADRYFYSSWWNATSIDAFWRKWNVPVHEWCLRHVYLDLQSYTGISKNMAVLATFFFSAVFHELIFSVSFKTFRPWFFVGMLMQIPLMAVGKKLTNTRRGNYLMWWSLFSGQPLLELLYFREYFKTHDDFFCNGGAHSQHSLMPEHYGST